MQLQQDVVFTDYDTYLFRWRNGKPALSFLWSLLYLLVYFVVAYMAVMGVARYVWYSRVILYSPQWLQQTLFHGDMARLHGCSKWRGFGQCEITCNAAWYLSMFLEQGEVQKTAQTLGYLFLHWTQSIVSLFELMKSFVIKVSLC